MFDKYLPSGTGRLASTRLPIGRVFGNPLSLTLLIFATTLAQLCLLPFLHYTTNICLCKILSLRSDVTEQIQKSSSMSAMSPVSTSTSQTPSPTNTLLYTFLSRGAPVGNKAEFAAHFFSVSFCNNNGNEIQFPLHDIPFGFLPPLPSRYALASFPAGNFLFLVRRGAAVRFFVLCKRRHMKSTDIDNRVFLTFTRRHLECKRFAFLSAH